MNTQICEAISNRKVIEFYYEGRLRRVEPHCHGVHKDSGEEVLRAYQVGGYSESGHEPPWRMYSVSKITDLVITNEIFSTARPGYNPSGDKSMSSIYCKI